MKIEFNVEENETGVKNDISELNGEIISTISGVEIDSEEVIITTATGKAIKLWHQQACQESVSLADFDGDPASLIGALVNCAEEVSSEQSDLDSENSQTWTFYKIETSKGGLWLRWLGESNGYYSEKVDVVGGRVVIGEAMP